MARPVHPKLSIQDIPGMTLREHYAGLYGAALLTAAVNSQGTFACGPSWCSALALEYADALLAALAEKPEVKP